MKNVQFCPSSRKAKILTAGIYGIFRGLKFEPDAEIGQKGTFFKGFYERLSLASYSSSASSPVCRLFPRASVVPKTPAEAVEHGEQPACIQSLLLSLYNPSPLILQRLFSCCFPYDLHSRVTGCRLRVTGYFQHATRNVEQTVTSVYSHVFWAA